MAKSDFICANCKEVKTQAFISLKTFHKYTCPTCGTLCDDCVETGIFSKPKCKKCGKKVIRYSWDGTHWKQS